MRGSFFGLNVAVRGLFAAQNNFDVISHNLNNVNTPGYSRQYGVQQASRPLSLFDGTGMVGTGAEVTAVKRFRDEFLDQKYWRETTSNGEWSAKQELLADLEVTFNEPSPNELAGSGFTKITNEFYDLMQELSKKPGDLSVRAALRQKAVTYAKYFNSMAARFEKLQQDINHRVGTKVSEVNTLAEQIGQLNKQIYNAELDGNTANDLRDQRTVLVDKLSKLVDIQASEVVVGTLPNGAENRHFTISIGGKNLVDHYQVTKLKTVQRDAAHKVNDEDVEQLYDIQWEDGNSVTIRGGELRGYLDARDGNEGTSGTNGIASPVYKGIPYYIKKLNEFVRTFAKAFDMGMGTAPDHVAGHSEGYGMDGSTGKKFFTVLDASGNPVASSTFTNYNNMTAKNFCVSKDVMDDLKVIATSKIAGDIEDASILKNLIGFRHASSMFKEGSPEDFMKALVVNLGIDSQQAQRIANNQKTIVKQIDNQRVSVSGVSIDEELSNMVRYQQSYNACARMITTMAEIYDTLINRTGVR